MVPLIPTLSGGREVRMLDRVFDNHVMSTDAGDRRGASAVPEHGTPDQARIAPGREALDKVYHWLDDRLAGRHGPPATPSRWPIALPRPPCSTPIGCEPIPDALTALKAYRARVLAQPSVSRVRRRGSALSPAVSRSAHPTAIKRRPRAFRSS